MIKYLPHPIGTMVIDKDNRFAIVNQFTRRDNDYVYSLSYFRGDYDLIGKAAWTFHYELKHFNEPTLESLDFLEKAGDL